MATRTVCCCWIVVVLAYSAGCSRRTAALNENEIRAIALLSRSYDTMVRATRDAALGLDEQGRGPAAIARALRIPFSELRNGLEHVTKGRTREALAEGMVVLVGARDFRAPRGLGLAQFDFCYIVICKPSRHNCLGLDALDRSIVSETSETDVRRWRVPPSESRPDGVDFFLSQVDASYLIVTNNFGATREIMTQLASLVVPTGEEREEFEALGRFEYWARRSFDTKWSGAKRSLGTEDLGDRVRALLLLMHPEDGSGSFRLVSTNDDDPSAARLNARAPIPRFVHVQRGVWEAQVRGEAGDIAVSGLLAILGLLGFSVYL